MDREAHPDLIAQSNADAAATTPSFLLVDAVRVALLAEDATSTGRITLPFDPVHAQSVFLQDGALIIITNSGSAYILEDFLIAVEIDLLQEILLPTGEALHPLDFLENFTTDPALIDDLNSIDAANSGSSMSLAIDDMLDMNGNGDIQAMVQTLPANIQAVTTEPGIAGTTAAPFPVPGLPIALFQNATSEEPVF